MDFRVFFQEPIDAEPSGRVAHAIVECHHAPESGALCIVVDFAQPQTKSLFKIVGAKVGECGALFCRGEYRSNAQIGVDLFAEVDAHLLTRREQGVAQVVDANALGHGRESALCRESAVDNERVARDETRPR